MFDALEIRNFRGFEDLKIAPLKRINLFTGENNVGKTNVLEAIYLLFASEGDRVKQLPSAFRAYQSGQDDRENFWMWLFFQRDYQRRIEIKGLKDGGETFSLAIDLVDNADQSALSASPPALSNTSVERRQFYFTYKYEGLEYRQSNTPNPSQGLRQVKSNPNIVPPSVAIFSTAPSDPAKDAIEYNKIVLKAGGEEQMEELLRIVEPRLKKLRSLQVGNRPLLYADIGMGNLIPVTQLGQGFNRLLTIFSAMLVSQAKIFLVDEIENGLHYTVQRTVWEGLGEAARRADVQVFATTHSWGCIVAAHEAFAESKEYDFALHRLQSVKGKIEAVTYDREMLETSLKAELEVR